MRSDKNTYKLLATTNMVVRDSVCVYDFSIISSICYEAIAFHLKTDQDIFGQIVVAFMHY